MLLPNLSLVEEEVPSSLFEKDDLVGGGEEGQGGEEEGACADGEGSLKEVRRKKSHSSV